MIAFRQNCIMPSQKKKNRPYLLGIAGRSGSGKTYLLHYLQAELGTEQVSVLSQDDYYLPIGQQQKDEQGEVNFDLPEAIDRKAFFEDLNKLLRGETLSLKRYTFNNPSAIAQSFQIKSRTILIIEGLFIYHYPEIHQLIDTTVFIDCSTEKALERRIRRDAAERGYDRDTVIYQWEHHVEPAFERYLLPYRNSADFIIENTEELNGAEALLAVLKSKA